MTEALWFACVCGLSAFLVSAVTGMLMGRESARCLPGGALICGFMTAAGAYDYETWHIVQGLLYGVSGHFLYMAWPGAFDSGWKGWI